MTVEWIDIDANEPIVHHFTDDELISSVQNENEDEKSDSENESLPAKNATIDECINLRLYIHQLITVFRRARKVRIH